MNVLVLNSGSSSLKFQVIETDLEAIEKNADRQLARGVIERIGSEALVNLEVEGRPALRRTAALRDHPRRSTTCCAGWSRRRPAFRESRRSATSTPSATASSTAARSFTRSTLISDEVVDADRGLHRARAAAQPGEPEGHRRGARAARPGSAAGGRVRHLVPLDDARGGLPLRDPVPALRAPPHTPLRLPRHLAPLRGLPLPRSSRAGRARTRTSSRCTSATAARPARSSAASRSTPRWASRRSRAW